MAGVFAEFSHKFAEVQETVELSSRYAIRKGFCYNFLCMVCSLRMALSRFNSCYMGTPICGSSANWGYANNLVIKLGHGAQVLFTFLLIYSSMESAHPAGNNLLDIRAKQFNVRAVEISFGKHKAPLRKEAGEEFKFNCQLYSHSFTTPVVSRCNPRDLEAIIVR